MLDKTFYGNTIATWLLALGVLVLTFAVGRLVYWTFKNMIRKITSKTKTRLDDIIIDTIEEPLSLAIILIGVWWGLKMLVLPAGLTSLISKSYYFLIVINAAWFFNRLFDTLIKEYVAPMVAKSESDLDDQLLPILGKGVKIIVWTVAVIVALDNAGYDVGAILAGLGIGGLAFAMAAKDTVANLFGGFTIFADRPFKINDRIVIDSVDGTVKEIGIRSTRIQTLEGRTVTIPNSKFQNSVIENISSEPSRKVALNLGLTYDMDPEKVELAMEILREIAAKHADSIEEKTPLGFNAFGDSALNILFIYYIKKEADILGTMTSINMDILSRFNQAGLDFAFPSQTIYHKPA